eukprot:5794701-Prymnesium_polylepis.2
MERVGCAWDLLVPTLHLLGWVWPLCDSRLVRQLCTMSRRTAWWRQPVHSTSTLTVNERVGRLPSDKDSRLRIRTGYNSLTCGKAPFCSVRDYPGPQLAHSPVLACVWGRVSRHRASSLARHACRSHVFACLVTVAG